METPNTIATRRAIEMATQERTQALGIARDIIVAFLSSDQKEQVKPERLGVVLVETATKIEKYLKAGQ